MKKLLACALWILIAPPPARAFLPADSLAFVIHGNDRTLAALEKPSGPAHLNLASLGTFPNEIVIRGDRACVVASGSDAIHVLDLASCAPVDTIPTGAGTNPYGIAFISDTRAYVSLLLTHEVVEIDVASGAILDHIPVGRSPEGVAHAAGRVFVANSGFDFSTFNYDPGSVSVIDPATNLVTDTLPVGLNPQALATAPNGELHVCCTGDYFSAFGRAFMIDPALPAVVDSLNVGGSPGFIAIDPDGDAYLSDYFLGLLKYDAASRALLRDASNPIAVGTGAAGVAFCGGRAYVCVFGDDQLVILDAADNATDVIPLGDGPQDIAFLVPEAPVGVTLTSFTGTVNEAVVHLSWTTGADWDHPGFHVYRSEIPAGPLSRRTSELVTADAPGRYSWRDAIGDVGPGTALTYVLRAVDRAGREEPAGELTMTVPAASGVALRPPFPNPVRGAGTTISFTVGGDAPVRLKVFDAAGREARRLVDGRLPAGRHEISWDGRGADGSMLPDGVYFLRLSAGSVHRTGRVVIAP